MTHRTQGSSEDTMKREMIAEVLEHIVGQFDIICHHEAVRIGVNPADLRAYIVSVLWHTKRGEAISVLINPRAEAEERS